MAKSFKQEAEDWEGDIPRGKTPLAIGGELIGGLIHGHRVTCQLVSLLIFNLVLIYEGYRFLSRAWVSVYAVSWMFITALILAYEQWRILVALRMQARPPEGKPLTYLGVANQMTLLRGLLICGLGGFLFSPRPDGWLAWMPAILYSMAITADLFDGCLARLREETSVFGKLLDQDFDALGTLIAALLAFQYGQVPLWYVSVGAAYYFFHLGIWVRKMLGKAVRPLPPSTYRRFMASFQMVLIAVILFPIFRPPLTAIAAGIFMIPVMAGFLWDWLVVSERIVPRAGHPWLAFSRRGGPNRGV